MASVSQEEADSCSPLRTFLLQGFFCRHANWWAASGSFPLSFSLFDVGGVESGSRRFGGEEFLELRENFTFGGKWARQWGAKRQGDVVHTVDRAGAV